MPQISIIVPVYKVEPYLRRCVDSILNQTFTDFELILVDDGSPDNCGVICDEYAAKDNRVHVIHQKNGGLSAARNAGIDWAFAHSDSSWLTFVDSDDWIHPQMLEILYHTAVDNHVKVSICSFAITHGEKPEVLPDEYKVSIYTPADFYNSVAWGKLYYKNCFQNIRYPVGRIHEDEFTTYRILFQQEKIAVTEAPLYFYYQNTQSIMHTKWSPKRLDSVIALREQTEFFKGHGFHRPYRITSAEYASNIFKQRENVQNSDLSPGEKKKYDRYLLQCLRKASWDYRDVYLKYEHGVYVEAYPMLTGVYRKIKGILKRT